ncbi:hypothetical protein SSX86_008309 [Deinandra increscens subsp. villosa]|uniref:Cobalamin-independent methionine synthase MetE C-terminal/archaeal domain-containing protein n=1 Tax=Deinandra increscens subsp. villosa TaxID=3103831 RepID=A0AAP0H3Y0_9ASTR
MFKGLVGGGRWYAFRLIFADVHHSVPYFNATTDIAIVYTMHAHLDDPGREEWGGFPSGTKAAVAGMLVREVIAELKAAGATWIQFDEAILVKDLEAH